MALIDELEGDLEVQQLLSPVDKRPTAESIAALQSSLDLAREQIAKLDAPVPAEEVGS